MKLLSRILFLQFFAFVTLINADQSLPNDLISASSTNSDFLTAKEYALERLSEQIIVIVWSSTSSDISENSSGIDENYRKVIKTHSAAILRNVDIERFDLPNGQIQVSASIKRTEIENVFNERRQLIIEMCNNAENNLNNINIRQALKNYYFAIVLIKSLPEGSFISTGTNYTAHIPKRINEILENIKLTFYSTPVYENEISPIQVEALYKSNPVSFMDFTIWDGDQHVEVGIMNGRGSFQLLGASVNFKSVRTSITYSYPENIQEFSIVEQLWDIVSKPSFNTARIIAIDTQTIEVLNPPDLQKNFVYKFNLSTELKDAPIEHISQQTYSLMTAITGKGELHSNDEYLSNKIARYLNYNHPSLMRDEYMATINQTHSGYELRSLPILHSYPSLPKQTTEFMVLDFDSLGTLTDFNTAIPDVQYKKILLQSEFANDRDNKYQIIKFLEMFRTSYLTRDITTLDLMYADGALIIVGNILKKSQLSTDGSIDFQQFDDQPNVEYLLRSKREYLSALKTIFDKNLDVFINFSALQVVTKNNAPGVYGIEMRQDWHSQGANGPGYADEGYLFLLIDFEQKAPTIYVRAWQQNEWAQDQLIRASNYRVYK